MTLLLTLFFVSLLGIIGMVWRKLSLVPLEVHKQRDDESFEIPHFEELKSTGINNIRKYGYATLVLSLRVYVRSINLLKAQYQEIEKQLKAAKKKNVSSQEIENTASKFLDKISEYKHKIRRIKRKIAEEEKSL